MLGRPWNFLKRHKKKILFGGVALGGASYAAWHYLLPKLSDMLVQRMIRELAKDGSEDPEDYPRRRFEHKQKVADDHARRALMGLRKRLNECFKVEECTAQLQAAKTKEEKLDALLAMCIECMTKVATAVFTLQLMLLMYRVGFNIVGREMAEASDVAQPKIVEVTDEASAGPSSEDVHERFLAFLDCHECGCERIAEAVRAAVKAAVERYELTAQLHVGNETLKAVFQDVCREAGAALLGNAQTAAWLLPDSLDSRLDPVVHDRVKSLLDEARDYLDSPHFAQIFQVSCSQSSVILANALITEIGGARDPLGNWPLAKFNGAFTKLSGAVLDNTKLPDAQEGEDAVPATEFVGAVIAERFATEPRVEELCSSLYFQEQ